MATFLLYSPTTEFLGLQLYTRNGDTDIKVRTVSSKWRTLHREDLDGQWAFVYDTVTAAYWAGYADGLRRPIRERLLVQMTGGEDAD